MADRVSQVIVEVFSQPVPKTRLTQVVVEVFVTLPVHPFGEQPFPEYPDWSPTYIVDQHDGANAYASLYGLHSKIINLGRRRHWQTFERR